MNKHLYRIIFNERRGQLMVVAENAASPGKASGAEGAGSDGAVDAGGGWGNNLDAVLRPLCLALSGALYLPALATWATLGGLLAAPVQAQIVADPGAAGKLRPTVLQAANGVVQVNIQTPSAAGVSRNLYSRFDVTPNGAVLNNSRTDVQSQLGGYVQGNPWLQTGPARVVLNEVNSANPSQLRGYVELAGARAELVIANPAGINIDGAGFINASRVTLTTGAPQMNNGNLDGYLVQRGAVSINGLGLDAGQVDYTAILARAVQVNAGIWAKELRVATGVNRIGAADAVNAAGAPAEGGAAPAFALDVAQLGGMYAGKITLIGTEAGVGVRNAGLLAASSGALVLESNGWLSNSGRMQATAPGADVRIDSAGDIANSGRVYAGGDAHLASGANIGNSGGIGAGRDTTLLAGAASRIDAGGADAQVAAGVHADGTLGTGGDLRMTAGAAVSLHGTGAAPGKIVLDAHQLELADATLSGQHVTLTAGTSGIDASRASLTAQDTLALDATHTVRTDGAKLAAGQLVLAARDLSNVGGKITQFGAGDLALALPGRLDNTRGQIGSNGRNLNLGAATLLNVDGKIEHAGEGTLAIATGAGALDNRRGHITGNGALSIAAGDIDQRDGAIAARRIALDAASLDNRGGAISQTGAGAGALNIGRHLDNRGGTIASQGGATIAAATLDNGAGRISAHDSVSVELGAGAALSNVDGVIVGAVNLALRAGNVDNSRGNLRALDGDATLRVSGLNNAGNIYAGATLDTSAAKVDNSGSLYAAGAQRLSVGGALANSGSIVSQGNNSIRADSLLSGPDSLLGAGVGPSGALADAGDLNVTTVRGLEAHGQNLAAGSATLAGAALDLSGGRTGAANIALSASTGNIVTSNAMVTTPGSLTLTASADGQGLVNTRGTLSGGQVLSKLANLDNAHGTLLQTGAGQAQLVLSSPNGVLDNTQGRIAANGLNLSLGAATLHNVDGKIDHAGAGTLAINAGSLNDTRGRITGNGMVDIAAAGFDHRDGNTIGTSVKVRADSLDNRGGHLLQRGDGTLALEIAGRLDNKGGEIASHGDLGLRAGALDNGASRITSAASAEVTSAGALNNVDGLIGAVQALAIGGDAIDNTRGRMQTDNGALTLKAGTLQNAQGTLRSGGDLTAATRADFRNDGVLYAGRDQTLQVGGALTNGVSLTSFGNTTITADSVHSGTGSLLGAGIRADGTLAPAGNLTVSAARALYATGINLAAGDISLNGATVDVGGGQTSAANVALAAASGNVNTALAQVSTPGTLSVTANATPGQTLDNAQGRLSAGQLDLKLANLNNRYGSIIQSGTGDTAIVLSAPDGRFDNTAGRIAVNSANLSLGAGTLSNVDGKIEHAGTGTLAIGATSALQDQRGQITGNGALNVNAGEFDHRDASTSAQRVTIDSASLDNRAGHISQLGAGQGRVSAAGRLDNGAGVIESNGDMGASAATLDNGGGRIAARGNASVGASALLNNVDGYIVGANNLSVLAGNVNNTRGSLQALAGDAVLRVADLDNNGGKIYAAGRLDTAAANVDNGGTMYAAGSQVLNASGAILNSGVIAAAGSTTIRAASLESGAASFLGAGVTLEGQLARAGDLNVTTAGGLGAHGQNLAAGNAVLSGGSLDLSHSQTDAANITLSASVGNIVTSDAAVTTPGTLALNAGADGQSLVNTRGTLSAGRLQTRLANLDNAHGTIIQSGSGDASIVLTSATGVLDNTQGSIAVNSHNLSLGAATLNNVDGKIEHAGSGTLAISARHFNDARGQINSNGTLDLSVDEFDHQGANTSARSLSVRAGSLDNRGGHLLQRGDGNMTVQVERLLNNGGGEIAANGVLGVQAGSLENGHGRITAQVAGDVASLGGLDNREGLIAAGKRLTVAALDLDNRAGAITQLTDGHTAVTVGARLDNRGGMIESQGDSTVDAGTLDNSGGRITASAGVGVGGRSALLNTQGFIAGGTHLNVSGGNVDNTRGVLQALGGDASLRVADLKNTGKIYASGRLDTTAANVDNSGSLYAGGAQTLAASGAVVNIGVIAAQGHTSIVAGSLDSGADSLLGAGVDADGKLVQAGNLSVSTTHLLAAHGQNLAAGDAALAGGALDLGGSHTDAANIALGASAGDIVTSKARLITPGTLSASAAGAGQTLVNHEGLLSAGQLLTSLGNLDNAHGEIVQSGAGDTAIVLTSASGVLNNSAGRLAVNSRNLNLGAATLNNIDGKIEHGGRGTLAIAAGQFDDTRGALTGNGALDVAAGEFIHRDANTSMRSVKVRAASLDNRSGHLLQRGDGAMALDVAGRLDNGGGEIAANGALGLQAGALDNGHGRITSAASGAVAVHGALDNSEGFIAAAQALAVAGEAIENKRGTMQAENGGLSLTAASIDNNEGILKAGTDLTAATRGDLRNSGVLYAGRDQTLNVGGVLVNSATVSALGNTTITAASVQSGADSLLGAGIRTDGHLAPSGNLTVTAAQVLQALGHNLAAGDAALSGAALDLGGSRTNAVNIALSASSGNISTALAQVSATGTLSATTGAAPGQTLDNAQGRLSAAQLAIKVANLDNRRGEIIQSGSGDTRIVLSAPDGRFDNTAGHVIANSRNLNLGAGTLLNIDGKIEHAGNGTLAITAGTLSGQRGQITGNGALSIAAGDIDHRGAATSAQQIGITAANLDNSGGRIAQLGAGQGGIGVGARLSNGGGIIESNGDMAVGAAVLDNAGGRISAVGNVSAGASVILSNRDGYITGGRDLGISGGDVDNTGGNLQALAGDATLRVANLTNAGNIYAAGRLDTTAAGVDNSGSMYAGGDQSLAVGAALRNSGQIAAKGDTGITADSLLSTKTGVLGAGMELSGAISQAGALNVTTAQRLEAHGQNLAGGRATLNGATLDLSGSQTGGADIVLGAKVGNIDTGKARLVTPGTLTINAAGAGQSLLNVDGTLSAGKLVAQLGNLDNTRGVIIQTGNADTTLVLTSPSGMFNNTLGRISVNSANLTLGAATLNNSDGKIEHGGSGTLAIKAATLNGIRGQITGNGALTIKADEIDHRDASTFAHQMTLTAANLDNRKGNFTQLGTAHGTFDVSALLDNRDGTIGSNGDLALSAATLNNQGGLLRTTGEANLTVDVVGVLDNSNKGRMLAGGKASLGAAEILNALGEVTVSGALSVKSAGAVHNAGGKLAANGDLALEAATFDNTGGKLLSGLGKLDLTTGGAIDNQGGLIQAGLDLALRSAGLANGQAGGQGDGGKIVGRNVTIDTGGQTLDNRRGTIGAGAALDVHSGAIMNDGGLLQSGAALTLDTNGQTLSNRDAAMYSNGLGGIVSGGTAVLHVGNWDNAGGYLGAVGAVSGKAGVIDNSQAGGVGGQIVGKSSVNLTIGSLINQGGSVQGVGDVSLNAGGGTINNNGGLIRSSAKLALLAAAIDNHATKGAEQGIEGMDVDLNTAALNNAQGAVRANADVRIVSSGNIDNRGGLISALHELSVGEAGAGRSLTVNNTGGEMIGGTSTKLSVANIQGDGNLLSLGTMSIDLAGAYVHGAGAEIRSKGSASIVLGGDMINMGTMHFDGTLDIKVRNFDNTASGDIWAGTTRIAASGVLNNHGLIDGVNTELDAGTLNNSGTGRIYGNHLSIAAGALNNEVEGGVAATIAARQRLDLGVQSLSNREHTLIFSGGDMVIGGALDGNRNAGGRAGSVVNASATIEAVGQLTIGAGQVSNLNNHFSIAMGAPRAPTYVTEYQGEGSPKRYGTDTVGLSTFLEESVHLRTPDGVYESWTQYNITRVIRESEITSTDPGRIVAGGNLSIDAGSTVNDNSHILAGGALSLGGGTLDNIETKGERITQDSGTAISNWRIHQKGTDKTGIASTGYAPPEIVSSITVSDERHEEGVGGGMNSAPGATTAGNINGGTSAAGSSGSAVNPNAIVKLNPGINAGGAANGLQAGTATGADGLDAGAAGGSGPSGTVGGANGAQANNAGGVDPAGSAAPTAMGGGAAGKVGDSTLAGASGAAGQNATDRSAGTTGSGSAATTSTLPGGVADRTVGGAKAATGVDGTGRTAGAGGGSAPGAVKGLQAAGAVGSGGPGRAAQLISPSSAIADPSGAAAQSAGSGAAPGAARMDHITQVALSAPGGSAEVVRTSAPSTRLPNASLYNTDPARAAGYLVETDPRFANYGKWQGSDYMLGQLQLDPEVTQKRLGDGFYEQSLVRAQVAQLTGQRHLGDASSDDAEYRALMDAGISYAKQYNLRPGVALSAAQMAALSSDIVWMVEQEVTLADGTRQKVLAPQVYVRVRAGDIDGGGALLSGKSVDIKMAGNAFNSGTVAGREVVKLTAENVQNLGGRISGNTVTLDARVDVNNIGGALLANNALTLTAGRDIKIESTVRSASSAADGNSFSRTTIDRVAGLYVTGTGAGGKLSLTAGRDITLTAGQIGNNSVNGATSLDAGRNIELGTLTTASANKLVWDVNNYRKDSSTNEVGSQIFGGGGSVLLKAGADVNARAATVQTGGALTVQAGNDINILAGSERNTVDEGHRHTDKGFLHTEVITTRNTLAGTDAVGSSLGGGTVALSAGRDIGVTGSTVTGDSGVALVAGRDVTIAAATETLSTGTYRSVKESGFLGGGGGFGISYGERTTTTDQSRDATTQGGQARSALGAPNGNLVISAGNALKIGGSDVAAKGDMALSGKSVTVDAGVDDSRGLVKTKTTQDALSLAVGGSVVGAIQAAQGMGASLNKSKDARLTAMAAATAAMAAANAAKALAAEGLSVNISLTAGHAESEQTRTTTNTEHTGSTIAAGNNLSISATGGGKDSNIVIAGSDVKAGNALTLTAGNQISVTSAQDLESQHSESKSMNAAAGVAAGYSSKGGLAIGFTGSAGLGQGKEDGEGVTQRNSHVVAGGKLTLISGGDTAIQGAVLKGAQVEADVGGNLHIESRQDTATFDSKNQSVNVSAIVGYGASVSGNINQSKIRSDYASVQEQSGIQAGDGGFQVRVGGNTDLKGATIGSTAAGAAASLLSTGTLTQSDIANHATMQASSVGLSGSTTVAGSGGGENRGKGAGPGGADLMDRGTGKNDGVKMPGVGFASNNDASTTRSGVGAGGLQIRDNAGQLAASGRDAAQTVEGTNRNVVTGVDTSGRIANTFNQAEVQTALDVTKSFSEMAAPLGASLAGDLAQGKETDALKEYQKNQGLAEQARQNGDPEGEKRYQQLADTAGESAKSWGEDGVNRKLLHTVVQGGLGGLTGGLAGALGTVGGVLGGDLGRQLGAAMGQAEADKLHLEGNSRKELINTYTQTMATLGGALGGLATTGAAGQGGGALPGLMQGGNTAETVDVNNRQLHPKEIEKITKVSKDFAKTLATELGRPVSELEAMQWLTKAGEGNVDRANQTWNASQNGAANTSESQAYFAAKKYLAESGTGSYTDASGKQQKLFVATGADFNNAAVNSEYRNDKNYRDYQWTVSGDNLKPDNPTVQEQAVYNEREAQRVAASAKGLATSLIPALIAGAAGSVKPTPSTFKPTYNEVPVPVHIQPRDVSSGANTSSSPTAPVFNPAGAARAEKFADFQQKVSARDTIANIAGDHPVITYTESGKTLYTNPTTGKQVVYDNAGKYFRVEDTTVSGPLRYTDQFGNPIPNNVPMIKKSGTSQTGVPADVRKALTHFTDGD